MAEEKTDPEKAAAKTAIAVACIQAFPRLLLVVVVALFLLVNKDVVQGVLKRMTGLTFGGFSIAVNYERLRKSADSPDSLKAIGNRTAILWARASEACYADAQILWVDDNPKNNTEYIKVIQDYGARVVEVKSTADAARLLDARTFDVVISDIGRGGSDEPEGLKMISEIQKRWTANPPPLIFFVGTGKEGPKPKGSFAITSRSDELIFYLTDALASRPGRC